MNGDRPHTIPSVDQIADVAYQIYLEEGRPEGRAMEHWYRAEQLLRDGRGDDDVVAPDDDPVANEPLLRERAPTRRRRLAAVTTH